MLYDLIDNVKEIDFPQSFTRDQAIHSVRRKFKKLFKNLKYMPEFQYLEGEAAQDRDDALNAIRNGKDVEQVVWLAQNVIMDYREQMGIYPRQQLEIEDGH